MSDASKSEGGAEFCAREGFWSLAFKDLWRTSRLIALFLVCAAILFIGVVYLFLPQIVDVATSHISEISFVGTTPTLKIREKGGVELYVVTVPAAQLFVRTGIRLEPERSYIIRATGAVSTAKGIPSKLMSSLRLGSSDLDAISKVWNPNWRDPDGALLAFADPDESAETTCVAESSSKLRLDSATTAPWGMLMAMVVKGPSPDYKAYRERSSNRNFELIAIGKGRTLIYESKTLRLNIKDVEGRALGAKDMAFLGSDFGELYFAVNDVVITDAGELTLSRECQAKADKREVKWREYSKRLYEALAKDTRQSKESIWYLDNEGSFTVQVVVTK